MKQILNQKTEILLNNRWRITPARMAEHLTQGRFKRFNHIQYLDKKISQAIAKGGGRIVISMPPRHGKSWLTSLYTPAWFLSLWPERNVILTSYEATFAASWGRQVRNFLQEHGKVIGLNLMDDSLASDRWNTYAGGGMTTAGAGGPITGKGADLILVDDICKNWEEASSATQQQKTIDWFNSTLYTRAEPGATIIVLMTRWGERDLIGYLLTEHQDSWEEIRLPAIAEENDPINREVGQALCPERYNEESLASIKAAVGTRVWEALYQQRPSAAEGNIFKREWWKFYNSTPEKFDQIIMSCDLTFKDTKNSDFVVLQIWGRIKADKYLIDQVRQRMDFPKTVKAICLLSEKYPAAHIKLVEDKANGPAVIAALKHEVSGLIAVEPNGSKEARACAVSAEIESGNVFLPTPSLAPWINDFIEECANFPQAKFNDQVDGMTQALFRFQSSGHIIDISKTFSEISLSLKKTSNFKF